MPNPRYATDATSLAEAIDHFEAAGFAAQLAARPGGRVRCVECTAESRAMDVELDALIRVEGASDPDDMVAVAALTCPACGAKGTVALKYGPEASLEEAEVLRDLEDRRSGPGVDP
jgi:hypothetical protein